MTVLIIALFAFSLHDREKVCGNVVTLPKIDVSDSPNGIVPLPETVPSVFSDVFVKYTKVIAPNGKPIHLLAQADWTDDKLFKVCNVLEHMLSDYPRSPFVSDNLIDVEYF